MLCDSNVGVNVVVGDLSLELLVDCGLDFFSELLFSGKNPDHLILNSYQILARVDKGVGGIISGEDSVVSASEGDEVNFAGSTIALGSGSSLFNLVSSFVVLSVEDSNVAVTLEGVACLITIVALEHHSLVSDLLEPGSKISCSLEVFLESRGGAFSN